MREIFKYEILTRDGDIVESFKPPEIVRGWIFRPAKVKKNYVEIPFRNGALDMTESLTGQPLYDFKEGEIEYIIHGKDGRERCDHITEKLNGKRVKIFCPNGKTEVGRVEVEYEIIGKDVYGLKVKGDFDV